MCQRRYKPLKNKITLATIWLQTNESNRQKQAPSIHRMRQHERGNSPVRFRENHTPHYGFPLAAQTETRYLCNELKQKRNCLTPKEKKYSNNP